MSGWSAGILMGTISFVHAAKHGSVIERFARSQSYKWSDRGIRHITRPATATATTLRLRLHFVSARAERRYGLRKNKIKGPLEFTKMKYLAKAVLLLGVLLVSVMPGISAKDKPGGDIGGFLVGVYVFGFAFISGIFAIFPEGIRTKNESGDKLRVGSINNLFTTQTVTFLTWFVWFCAVVVYFMAFHKSL